MPSTTLLPCSDEISPFARKLSARHPLGPRDLNVIAGLQARVAEVSRGTDIIVQGQAADRIHIVIEGWAARYRLLADGRRQILNFGLPGDLLGAQFALLSVAEHSICAVSEISVATFPAAELDRITRDHPTLAKAIHWSGAREWTMICERLINVGRRPAVDRIAHLLLELRARLNLVGRADGSSFELPITQEMIADSVGLTHVHVSRSIRKLRERGLLNYERNRIVIKDAERLAAAFDFSDRYLDHAPCRINGRDRSGAARALLAAVP